LMVYSVVRDCSGSGEDNGGRADLNTQSTKVSKE